jgi:hypothetical protein
VKAGAYTLDLYCDLRITVEDIAGGFDKNPNHGHREFPHQFVGDTYGECKKQAKKNGWKVGRWGEQDLCPKCAKAKKRK